MLIVAIKEVLAWAMNKYFQFSNNIISDVYHENFSYHIS